MKRKGKYEELTPERLRTYKGFENVSEEEAREQVQAIKVLAGVLFEIYKKENRASERE